MASNRIREVRMERGLTLDALGASVDLSMSQMSRLERDERGLTLHYMIRIARALGVHPIMLLPDEAIHPEWLRSPKS